MLGVKEGDVASKVKESSQVSEGEGGQDEFFTGKYRLPFSEDSDEEPSFDPDNSEDEEEE